MSLVIVEAKFGKEIIRFNLSPETSLETLQNIIKEEFQLSTVKLVGIKHGKIGDANQPLVCKLH